MTIRNAADSPIPTRVMDVSGAFRGLLQNITYGKVTKDVQNFEVVERFDISSFEGVVQPLTARQLALKPEGQRNWRWIMFHSTSLLSLANDDVVYYEQVRYRVTATWPWASYGFYEYHLCEDYQDREVTPPLPAPATLIKVTMDLNLTGTSEDIDLTTSGLDATKTIFRVYDLSTMQPVRSAVKILDTVTVRVMVPTAGSYRLIGEG